MIIAERVDAVLKDNDITVAQLADIMGVSRRTVEGWRYGKSAGGSAVCMLELLEDGQLWAGRARDGK